MLKHSETELNSVPIMWLYVASICYYWCYLKHQPAFTYTDIRLLQFVPISMAYDLQDMFWTVSDRWWIPMELLWPLLWPVETKWYLRIWYINYGTF